METAGVEPATGPLQAGCSATRASSPGSGDWCGRMESNHHSARRRGYSAMSSPDARRPQEQQGDRPDSNRYREDHDLGCCRYTTATTNGDDRTRTGDLSPDKRVLCPAELRPPGLIDGAGGIRTHGLELMRLARTAKLLYRAAGRTTIWPAGVEPAVSGARSRRGGLLPYSQMVQHPRRELNPQLPG